MDKKLAELLNPILEDLGFEMVRIRLSSGDPNTLQIMADRLNGQIGVDDLANINTSIGTILDVEDPIGENYILLPVTMPFMVVTWMMPTLRFQEQAQIS